MVENLNRQRVLKFLDVFYSGDLEGALARCSDDIDYIAPAPIEILPHLGHRRGKEAVRQMWQTVHKRYSSMRHEMPFIAAEDDKVAMHLRAFFTKRRRDRIVQFDVAIFFTIANGQVVKIREIIDTFDLIQQVVERDVISLIASKASPNI